jgi:hypothetical protein
MLTGIFSSAGACSALRSFDGLVLTLSWMIGNDLLWKASNSTAFFFFLIFRTLSSGDYRGRRRLSMRKLGFLNVIPGRIRIVVLGMRRHIAL